MSALRVVPLELAEANAFVAAHHRHHKPVRGHRFSIGAVSGDALVGVAIAGRPVARGWNKRRCIEVLRLCATGTKNVCSLLYSAVARAAAALGFEVVLSYIFASEHGTSLKASGWESAHKVKARAWSCQSRPRKSRPEEEQDKRCWLKVLNPPMPAVVVKLHANPDAQLALLLEAA